MSSENAVIPSGGGGGQENQGQGNGRGRGGQKGMQASNDSIGLMLIHGKSETGENVLSAANGAAKTRATAASGIMAMVS